jgi:hypothetical protein
LPLDQIRGCRLGNDYVGDAQVPRQLPDLGLEEVAKRVDRR